MARELRSIEITNTLDLLTLVEEVHRSQEPYLLRKDSEDFAVLMPAPRRKNVRSRAKPVDEADALFRGIARGKSGIPGGVSSKKHEYLARAYRDK